MRDEQGSAAVEIVLLTPVLVVLLLFVVFVGRLSAARGDVQAAAKDAARAASIARGPDSAREAGTKAARRSLNDGGVECRSLDVRIGADEFRPGGTVTAALTCTLDLSDLTLLGVPGSRTVAAMFREPVDTFRMVDR
jgi:Flp pilus assembly protein TadG